MLINTDQGKTSASIGSEPRRNIIKAIRTIMSTRIQENTTCDQNHSKLLKSPKCIESTHTSIFPQESESTQSTSILQSLHESSQLTESTDVGTNKNEFAWCSSICCQKHMYNVFRGNCSNVLRITKDLSTTSRTIDEEYKPNCSSIEQGSGYVQIEDYIYMWEKIGTYIKIKAGRGQYVMHKVYRESSNRRRDPPEFFVFTRKDFDPHLILDYLSYTDISYCWPSSTNVIKPEHSGPVGTSNKRSFHHKRGANNTLTYLYMGGECVMSVEKKKRQIMPFVHSVPIDGSSGNALCIVCPNYGGKRAMPYVVCLRHPNQEAFALVFSSNMSQFRNVKKPRIPRSLGHLIQIGYIQLESQMLGNTKCEGRVISFDGCVINTIFLMKFDSDDLEDIANTINERAENTWANPLFYAHLDV